MASSKRRQKLGAVLAVLSPFLAMASPRRPAVPPSLRKQQHRALQNIVVKYPAEEPEKVAPPPPPPPVENEPENEAANNNEEIPPGGGLTLVVCRVNTEEEEGISKTPVSLDYIAETDTLPADIVSSSEFFLSDELPSAVAAVAVAQIALELCTSSAACVTSVSSLERGVLDMDEACSPTLPVSQSCHVYRNMVVVVEHLEDECSLEEMEAMTRIAARDGFQDVVALEEVQEQLKTTTTTIDSSPPPPPLVTNLALYEEQERTVAGAAAAAAAAAPTGGLNPLGKAMLAVATLLIVVALLLLLLMWRRRRGDDHEKGMLQVCNNIAADDDDDGTALTGAENPYLYVPEEENHHVLARDGMNNDDDDNHRDVHKCKSALCPVCGPTLGVVTMVPVLQGEYCLPARVEDTTTAPDDDDDDSAHSSSSPPPPPAPPVTE